MIVFMAYMTPDILDGAHLKVKVVKTRGIITSIDENNDI